MTISTAGRNFIQALTLCQLLAASGNAAADDRDPVPVTPTTITADAPIPITESGGIGTARVDDVGLLSSLASGVAWPLFGGILLLAAANSRKPRAGRKEHSWHWPW